MTVLAFAIFLVAYVVAALGVVLPVLPGVPIAAVGALAAAAIMGFDRFGVNVLIHVGLLAVLSQVVDLAGTWLGSKYYGAGRAGTWGGIIGSFVGLLAFPPWGFLFGALVGAVVAELLIGRELYPAIRSGVGAFVGTLGGTVAKLVIMVVIGVIVFPRFFSG
ncbi:MAG: DUF456 family protein [Trueperaceae bacterium]|nr:DUF456 family protein [Trueperaceae bacterium]MCC6310762.1 DUF456 family protein [Trueperaceae bacterium]MCO5174145.1 DUF456 family protein [Trueperaceae bacterium]MCW5820494.1 DUF456 family protein [Trueperaceae bacterium]